MCMSHIWYPIWYFFDVDTVMRILFATAVTFKPSGPGSLMVAADGQLAYSCARHDPVVPADRIHQDRPAVKSTCQERDDQHAHRRRDANN